MIPVFLFVCCLFVLLFPIFLWLAQITTIFNAAITITKFNKPLILKFKRINIGILRFSCVVYEIILTRLLRSLKRKLMKTFWKIMLWALQDTLV